MCYLGYCRRRAAPYKPSSLLIPSRSADYLHFSGFECILMDKGKTVVSGKRRILSRTFKAPTPIRRTVKKDMKDIKARYDRYKFDSEMTE